MAAEICGAGAGTLTGVNAASIKAKTTATQSAAPPIVERLLITLTLPYAPPDRWQLQITTRLCLFPPIWISAVGRTPQP